MVNNLRSYAARKSNIFFVLLGFTLAVALELVDFVTGSEFAFSIFYLLPVAAITWFKGIKMGVLIVLTSVCVWFAGNVLALNMRQFSKFYAWDGTVRMGFFLTMIYILSVFKNALDKEKALARTDDLTQIPNRRGFFERTNAEIQQAQEENQPCTVAYMDIDNFKAVNDKLGHTAGDALLCSVAQTIKKNIRAMDTVARLGGDEFGILLPEAGMETVKTILPRVQQSLLETMQKKGWLVTFSIGAVTCQGQACSPEEIVRRADKLMYSVKNNGENNIVYEAMQHNGKVE